VRRRELILGALALAGCSGRGNNPPPQPCPPGTSGPGWPVCVANPPPPPPPAPVGQWSVGPVISGIQYSVGMPSSVGDRWDFPVGPVNHVAYVTKPLSLAGKSRIRFEWSVIGNGPFKPTAGDPPLTYVCLHFQKNGDNWSGIGPFDGFRWWSVDQVNIAAGDGMLDVPLQRDAWVSVLNNSDAAAFAAAQNDTCCVGFTFGNAEGKGHGIYAERPGSSFVVHSYEAI
jgi:hypothetical protein